MATNGTISREASALLADRLREELEDRRAEIRVITRLLERCAAAPPYA